jgi:tetratricopeptide (TPR) repeat protein
MKKFLPFFAALFVFYGAEAQDSAALKKHYLKVYTQALNYNDAGSAISALQNYIAVDNNVNYRDTLSILYFTTKNYYSALLLAEEVFAAAPANADAKARAAECYDELGDPAKATKLFEEVVPVTKSPYHLYKLAVCQYQLKRIAEAERSARMVIADTSSKNIGVAFTSMDGSVQAVRANAAAANLLGVLQMDAKNYAEAKKLFQQALTMHPEFSGAKGNLDVCDKNLKGTKPPTKPATKPTTTKPNG